MRWPVRLQVLANFAGMVLSMVKSFQGLQLLADTLAA
jgi:hypothetical protein